MDSRSTKSSKEGVMSDSESGWNRVKLLLTPRYHGEDIVDEVKDVPTIVFLASIMGLVFGGMIGARHAGDKYIALNHSTKYTSTMQAQRELHGAAMLGFVRQGAKWGWKMGLFAGIYSCSTVFVSVYRNKDDALNYIAAGAMTGGLFRVRAGLKPAVGGTLLGTLLCIPAGLLIQGLDRLLVGADERERMKRQKSENRDKLWNNKLQCTSSVIEDISSEDGLHKHYSLKSDSKHK